MGKLWELSDEVLLPDLPPPYTISEKNLWGSNVGKTRYVGFLASAGNGPLDSAANDIDSSSKPKVFWQVSGPPLTRAVLLRRAFEAAEALAGRFSFVVSAGNPSSTTEATRIPGGWFYGWCNIAEHYFRVCDVVVSRAGHGTIGQAVASSRPSLLIPIPKQPEQEGNAEKAVRLGVSLSISQHEFTLAKVAPLLEELIAGPFKEKATHLGEFARRFDAKKQIVSTIEAAASGARPRPR
jgi:UDP:flavonoid glycosyltransferase YjiC (YdhE family)